MVVQSRSLRQMEQSSVVAILWYADAVDLVRFGGAVFELLCWISVTGINPSSVFASFFTVKCVQVVWVLTGGERCRKIIFLFIQSDGEEVVYMAWAT